MLVPARAGAARPRRSAYISGEEVELHDDVDHNRRDDEPDASSEAEREDAADRAAREPALGRLANGRHWARSTRRADADLRVCARARAPPLPTTCTPSAPDPRAPSPRVAAAYAQQQSGVKKKRLVFFFVGAGLTAGERRGEKGRERHVARGARLWKVLEGARSVVAGPGRSGGPNVRKREG